MTKTAAKMISLGLILGVVGMASPANAGMNIPSEVSFARSDNFEQKFRGKVTSPAPDCVVGRKVKAYRVEPGQDQKLDKTFAAEDGRFRFKIPMQAGNKLYAVIETFETPLGNRCANDRSDTVNG
jgi:hypothetical protein